MTILKQCNNFVAIVGLFVFSSGLIVADDWPQWRGPDRTDVSKESGLLKSWPEDGPKRLWMSKEGGLGYSGFSIVGDDLLTMGADIDGDDEFVVCLSVKDGSKKWKTTVGSRLKNGWGDGPRSTPTIDGEFCYVLSGKGTIACLSMKNGDLKWSKKMADYGGKVPYWGYCESVLVDGENVICTPGGETPIVALKKTDGSTAWKTTDFKDTAQYSSIVKAVINNQTQYVQLMMKNIVGISPEDGSVLWKSDWPGQTAVIPTPIVKGNRVYVSSGYRVGCKAIEISADNKVKELWNNKEMINHHGGVILVGDALYGYCDSRKNGWTCQDFESGDKVWGEYDKLGKGAIAYADGKLYCLSESRGEVVLIDASKEGWKESGRFTLSPQTENRNPRGKVWVHPVIANGKLYLRDQELIYCYDIKQK